MMFTWFSFEKKKTIQNELTSIKVGYDYFWIGRFPKHQMKKKTNYVAS